MKNKHSRLLALLLAVLILVTLFASCSTSGNPNDSTENEIATTVTEAITTEEPSISVIVPPDTLPPEPDTGEESSSDSEEVTSPPTPTDYLRVLMQSGVGEAIVSQLSSKEDAEYLDRRMYEMTKNYSASITLSSSTNIYATVEASVLSGENDYDTLLLSASQSTELLCASLLEDLSEAGIEIAPESAGIHSPMTSSLSIGKGNYLLCPDGLVSDIYSCYALKFKPALISRNLVSEALSGDFTVDVLTRCIKDLQATANFDTAPEALFSALGGSFFVLNGMYLPETGLDSEGFAPAYNAASALFALSAKSTDAVFTLSLLSTPADGEVFLPLPKKDANSEYVTPVDLDKMTFLASPAGVVDGERLSYLIKAFDLSSSEYRGAVRERMLSVSIEGGKRSLARKLIENIESAAKSDLGLLLGWGDLKNYVSDGIRNGTSASALVSHREASLRRDAIKTASEIIAERLGIE